MSAPQPRTFAPSKNDVLANLMYFFGQPVSPEKLADYTEHHAMYVLRACARRRLRLSRCPVACAGPTTCPTPTWVRTRTQPPESAESYPLVHTPCLCLQTMTDCVFLSIIVFSKIRDTLNNLILKSPQSWQTSVGLPFFSITGTVRAGPLHGDPCARLLTDTVPRRSWSGMSASCSAPLARRCVAALLSAVGRPCVHRRIRFDVRLMQRVPYGALAARHPAPPPRALTPDRLPTQRACRACRRACAGASATASSAACAPRRSFERATPPHSAIAPRPPTVTGVRRASAW
jgi:hypothetical protein